MFKKKKQVQTFCHDRKRTLVSFFLLSVCIGSLVSQLILDIDLEQKMAGHHRANLEYVNYKLAFVEKLQSHLFAATTDYINEVVSTGRACIESSGDQATFSDISQKIDNAVDFLGLKCQEVSEQHKAQSAIENTSQEKQQVLKSAAALQPTPVVVTAQQHTHAADSEAERDLLHHQVLAKFGVIEEAIYSLRSNMEKITKQQTETDNRFENVTAKLSDLNRHMNDISIADKQEKKRMKEHIEKITDKQTEVQKQCESKLQNLEKLVKKLSVKQDMLEENANLFRNDMNEELERKIQNINGNTEIVECKIYALQASFKETDSSIKELLNRVVSQEQVTQSLFTKMDTNMETFETFSKTQERNVVIMKEFEDKLHIIETRVKEELEKLGEQFQATEISFKNVCQLMVNRLKPLEDLRSVLNQRARTQVDNVRKLHEMVKKVETISPKVTQLEAHLTTAIGFTAWTHNRRSKVVDSVLTSYSHFLCKDSDHFNLHTGIFTAPVAGIYVAFIKVSKSKDISDSAFYEVRCKSANPKASNIEPVCSVSTVKCGNACDLGLVQMNAGDELCVETDMNRLNYITTIVFSCFLIR